MGLIFTTYSLCILFPCWLNAGPCRLSNSIPETKLSWKSLGTVELGQEHQSQGAAEEVAGSWLPAHCHEVKEWTEATAQLLQWPSAMLICDVNTPLGHALVSKPHAFLAICNATYTYMVLGSYNPTSILRTRPADFSPPPDTEWPTHYSRGCSALGERSNHTCSLRRAVWL